jgi:hypothetical protein
VVKALEESDQRLSIYDCEWRLSGRSASWQHAETSFFQQRRKLQSKGFLMQGSTRLTRGCERPETGRNDERQILKPSETPLLRRSRSVFHGSLQRCTCHGRWYGLATSLARRYLLLLDRPVKERTDDRRVRRYMSPGPPSPR